MIVIKMIKIKLKEDSCVMRAGGWCRRCGLEGPGIELRVETGPGSHSSSCTMGVLSHSLG